MAVAYSTITQPGLLSQQYPPPLLPKPGKDNLRLQKLLKRAAKKKAAAQASQSAAPFRSSLSPVNEASPDLEHSDNSTPPRTPETPPSFFSIPPPPRFTVRPLYQHVASPYPQRAAYGRPANMSPQTVAVPSYSSQQVFTLSSFSASAHMSGVPAALGQTDQPAVPKISLPASSMSEATVPATELKMPALSESAETHAGPKAAAAEGSVQSKLTSLGPTPYSGGQAVIRPLTVLTPLVKSKSPRPTFRATERSRSPKPMFDVPQIRMYTASTSYYETSRTPPVYDTAGLTAIGSMVPQSKTPVETKQDFTPASEVRGGTVSTDQSPVLATDNAVSTPAVEIKRATPTAEIKVKTPTHELETSRISAGRPRTPAHNVPRATTPVFEISKPNPLLFAVTPITAEPERSSTSQTGSAEGTLSVSTAPPEMIPNGDIHSDMIPAAKPIQESTAKSKSESDLVKGLVPSDPVGSLTSTSTSTPAVTGYRRPKTPTSEASRLRSTSPGYRRPKTPTYGTPRSGVSPVAFQRPKTPTQASQKSGYRGLTPAEYAAYGGIKTHTPAFGLSAPVMVTQEVSVEAKTPSQGPSVKEQRAVEVPEVKETSKDADKPQQKDEKVVSVPTIVVSQASDTSGTMPTQETTTVSSQVSAKQETTVVHETPKVEPPKVERKTSEKQKAEAPAQETKPKPPEAKQLPPKGGDQDPLKAVKKLLGKGKVQTPEQKPVIETKAEVSEQREPVKPVASAPIKPEGSVAPAPPIKAPVADSGTADKGKDQKAEPASAVTSTPEHKEGDGTLPATESLLKVFQKPKGVKTKTSGWSRLKKHMVVEQEEPKFPETGPQKEVGGQDQSEVKKLDEKAGDKPGAQDESPTGHPPKATKMWDAVLFQMFSSKENIMHQIELNKSDAELKEEKTDAVKEIPSFAYRLPVLLFSPKFDAKKLREAASRPATKISTVFEMGLIGRKGKEEEPKDFNRTARGFAAS